MASHLNPPNWQSHVCNFSQLIRDIRFAGLTWLLGVKVEVYQLSTLPTSSLWTSSPTSGEPLAPSGSFMTSCLKITNKTIFYFLFERLNCSPNSTRIGQHTNVLMHSIASAIRKLFQIVHQLGALHNHAL
jgi:hypothetical protein